jgi:hypothetical protein
MPLFQLKTLILFCLWLVPSHSAIIISSKLRGTTFSPLMIHPPVRNQFQISIVGYCEPALSVRMKSNYYVKVMPRFNVGGALFFDCWNRSIGLLRRHRFISFVVCFCLNVFFVLDILVICGLFVDLNSANGRVHPSPSFRPSE